MAIARSSGMIGIQFDAKKVMTMLSGYERTIPEAMDIGTKNLAKIYARKYLEQLDNAPAVPPGPGTKKRIEPWTGKSHAILRKQMHQPTKLGKHSYGVVVPQSLVALDQMRMHTVAVRGILRQWAKAKLQTLGGGLMTVHPHPWINKANRNARRFVKTHPRREVERAIRRKGR